MKINTQLRQPDSYGAGHFGASRGGTTHKGIDHITIPGSDVYAPATGIITKLGYPYEDDLSFRYVEITGVHGFRYRSFYVAPLLSLPIGHPVRKGEAIIGTSQKLGDRYPADDKHEFPITEHIHFEIMDANGEYINPDKVIII